MRLRPAQNPTQPDRTWPLAGALLVLAVAAVYAHTLSAPFVFDDLPAVAQAARIARSGDGWSLFSPGDDPGETSRGRPLLGLTMVLNYALSQERTWSYRAVNVLIHTLAGLTLLALVRRTLQRPAFPDEVRGAALPLSAMVAMLWALHPLHTQAVTYVAQRAESLAGLFVLLTLLAAIRAFDSPRPGRWTALAVGCCALGMATKEVVAAAPLIVLLYDRTFVAGSAAGALRRRPGLYAGLAGTWAIVAVLVLASGGRGGTAGFDAGVSSWHYLLTQGHALATYLQLVVWPHPLVFDYGTNVARGVSEVLPEAALPGGLAIATLIALHRRSAWGFLGGFFFLVLAPSSSVVPVASQTMAEHRMYLAAVGPVVGLVLVLNVWLGRRALAVAVVLAVALGGLTLARNSVYGSPLALWADTAGKRPGNARAFHNLGLAEYRRDEPAAAAGHFERALQLDPGSADAHYNLGLCLSRMGRPAEAMARYEQALALRPAYPEAHNNLGSLLLALGRMAEARNHYEQALRLRPDFSEAHGNLSDVLLRQGEAGKAVEQAREATRLDPAYVEAWLHAGNACAQLGRFAEARRHFETAIRLRPADPRPYNNLANILLELDLPDEAITHYEQAVRLDPRLVDPRRNLALLLLHLQRVSAARPHLEVLGELLPGDLEIAARLREARRAGQP